MDCGECGNPNGVITTTAEQITDEIVSNTERGLQLGLPGDVDTMVQPDISGINTPPNPVAQKAAADAGIRYWIGDTSRPGQNNPTFNTGFYAPGDTRLYIVPRRPTNLFAPVSTPADWAAIYNYFYAPGGILCGTTQCFDRPQTYTQILEHESTYLLRYLLTGDLDPWMMHINNVRAYDGKHSVLTDLLDRTLARYDALVDVPIRSLSFKQAGMLQQARGTYNASGVKATITPCTSLTISTTNAATIPVTGLSYAGSGSKVEQYAGQSISNLSLAAGQSVTVPLPACGTTSTTGTTAAPTTTSTPGTTAAPTTTARRRRAPRRPPRRRRLLRRRPRPRGRSPRRRRRRRRRSSRRPRRSSRRPRRSSRRPRRSSRRHHDGQADDDHDQASSMNGGYA